MCLGILIRVGSDLRRVHGRTHLINYQTVQLILSMQSGEDLTDLRSAKLLGTDCKVSEKVCMPLRRLANIP